MTLHLASVRGWALALSALLAFAAAPVHAACNANPQARIGPNQQTLYPETINGQPAVVTLDASPSTPNGGNNVPTVAWAVVSKTPSTLVVNLQNANAFVASFAAPDVPSTGGSVRLRFTITCGDRSDFVETVINITDVVVNQPPNAVLTISPDPATEGQLVTLDGTASNDPDGTAITSWTFLQTGGPSVLLSNGNGAGSIKTFIAPNLPTTTTFTFQLTVASGGLQGITTKMVSVTFNNDVPNASLVCPGGIFTRNEGQSVTFDGSASNDPDGSIFSYAWSQNAGLPNLGVEAFTTPSITFNVPQLGLHQLGAMTVTLTVTDNLGAMKSATCGLMIKDVTAPLISVPADIDKEAEGPLGAVATFIVEAQDAVDDATPYPLACSPASGSTFALDALPGNALTTPVSCSATDSAGNNAVAGFNVTVRDTTPPTMSIPGGLGVEATGATGAIATFSATKSDLVDGAGDATCLPASGATFPLGATTVKCDAADARGNAAAQQSFVLNVIDSTGPTIDAHAPVGPIEATSAAGAPASYASPDTHDAVDGDGTATCAPPSGSTFPLGHSDVTCNATDSAGNPAIATTFDVHVVDTTKPTIDAHANLGPFEATSPAGRAVTYTAPETHDAVDGDGVATCLPASGATFALGTTTVHCNKTDAAGNAADETTFTVQVRDTTPPTIEAVASIDDVEATGPGGAVVTYASPATHDIVDGTGTALCTPASGGTFALGTTLVTCNAEDAAGNDATPRTFTIEVVDTTAPAIAPHANITGIEATGPGGAAVPYTSPTTTDAVDGPGVASCAPVSGATFALGTTTVNCSATDAAGNTSGSTFTVQVVDTTPPTIAPHAPVTVEATGPFGALATYTPPATSDIVDGAGTANCLPASGTQFALGNTTVHCRASDAAGNHAAPTSFVLSVVDTTPPTIEAVASIDDIEATGPGGAVVNYTSPATHDIVDGDGVATCAPLSGSTFALGTTIVTCNAQDDAGNDATARTFTVEVVDTTAPAIAPHASITGVEATGPSGAPVSYASPTTSDAVDGPGVASCTPLSGATFALGTTTVNCSATDDAGNSASSSFTVQVVDTTAPVIDAHANIGPVEATGPSGANVNYTRPTARDIVDGNTLANCAPPSGTFALGTTTVNCSATDNAGNAATPTSFTVTVHDTTAPVIAAHADLVIEATSPAGAISNYTRPATSDAVDGAGTATCTAAPGSQFALGVHTVTCNATDNAGNAATPTTFKITVQDTTKPVIAPHADIDVIALANSNAVVTYTSPTASDIVDTDVPVNCLPISGATFPAGTTTVTCTAIDDAGNTATSTFKVNVRYAFTGFFKPIDNLPIVNVVKAGQAIPVKFSLGGNQGLNIFAAGYPKSQVMACSSGALLDAIEETVTAGGSSLGYDALTGQYIYVWKTEKSWGGTCRQLQVTFADGTTKIAHFNFTR